MYKGGELFEVLMNVGNFTENDAADVILSLCEAVCYLHEMNIVHRDLKPGRFYILVLNILVENIFMRDPRQQDFSDVVLGDFGISRILEENNLFLKTMVYYLNFLNSD